MPHTYSSAYSSVMALSTLEVQSSSSSYPRHSQRRSSAPSKLAPEIFPDGLDSDIDIAPPEASVPAQPVRSRQPNCDPLIVSSDWYRWHPSETSINGIVDVSVGGDNNGDDDDSRLLNHTDERLNSEAGHPIAVIFGESKLEDALSGSAQSEPTYPTMATSPSSTGINYKGYNRSCEQISPRSNPPSDPIDMYISYLEKRAATNPNSKWTATAQGKSGSCLPSSMTRPPHGYRPQDIRAGDNTGVTYQQHSLERVRAPIRPSPWYFNITPMEYDAFFRGYSSSIACPAHWPHQSLWPENSRLTSCLAPPHYLSGPEAEYGPCGWYLQSRIDEVEASKRDVERRWWGIHLDLRVGEKTWPEETDTVERVNSSLEDVHWDWEPGEAPESCSDCFGSARCRQSAMSQRGRTGH